MHCIDGFVFISLFVQSFSLGVGCIHYISLPQPSSDLHWPFSSHGLHLYDLVQSKHFHIDNIYIYVNYASLCSYESKLNCIHIFE